METTKIITGATEDDIWQQINDDLLGEEDVLSYNVIIKQYERQVILDIDIDPGGGFEGGYEITSFTANINNTCGFHFKMHDENFIDEIGELFGMSHLKTGDADFDKKVLVKTNDEAKAKNILADQTTRDFFKSLENYSLAIVKNEEDHHEQYSLELCIDDGITDPLELRKIYVHYFSVLTKIDNVAQETTVLQQV
jgi:hypothetical protein